MTITSNIPEHQTTGSTAAGIVNTVAPTSIPATRLRRSGDDHRIARNAFVAWRSRFAACSTNAGRPVDKATAHRQAALVGRSQG